MKILLHFLAALLKEFLVQFLWTFNMCQYVLETALTRLEPIHIPLHDFFKKALNSEKIIT